MFEKAVVLILVLGAAAAAQSSSGYVFVGPGGLTSSGYTSGTLHIGGGVDAILGRGLGLNIELGVLGPSDRFEGAVGLFSPGATYYFRHRKELKLEPFVAGGYSLMFRQGHANLGYFGGGMNYWFSNRVGVRTEVRDHVTTEYGRAAHFWGVRFGLSFR
jgi:hypothetical protein